MNKTIYINTLGCAKNEVDSKKMATKLKKAGYQITDDYELADLFIINTCSFIESATSESIDTVLDFLDIKNERNVAVVVSGCMPSRYAANLSDQMPEVDAFLPCADEHNVVEVVSSLIGLPTKKNELVESDVDRIISAYVKISEGCDRTCAFCTIPLIRGKYHSYTMEQIASDVKNAVDAGAKEINFVAQDTGHWGRDFSEKQTLAGLLEFIAQKFPDTYFRVLYVQPDEVTDDLLFAIQKNNNIINYLDIPLQHVSEHVLRDMKRTGSAQDFMARINRIKEIIPDVTLRTTLMVGFPGETDDDFQELLDFASLGIFDYVGVFSYSNEDDAASHDYPDQVDEEEKSYRLGEITDLVDSIAASKIRERMGQTYKVIIEGQEEDGQLYGRALFQAPEVDGLVYVDKGMPGQVVEAEMIDSLLYDLEGEAK
ncbi:30S ribosomal protein S12 methylthiotransferase RimO [Phoenicibacter congonensis]|uniref:30S ribosomal protein S12 methylthiotransferase RimO n=1 Tax=Phoenicibacter congonensis TaxID=1944646 RepID=UPI0009A8C934|nr:30S ribosomal protein S12 methylthiotransferase RimO [Phoenicibacter congonensis]